MCFLDQGLHFNANLMPAFFVALHLTRHHRCSYTCLPIVLQAEKVFNQDLYYKRTLKYVGEPMTHLEAIASSAVRSMCSQIPAFV